MANEANILKDHYFDRKYLKRERMYSFVEQIEVLKKYVFESDSLLEVGLGNGFVTGFLRDYLGYQQIKTVDVNATLGPDIVDDIINPTVLKSNSFDVVSCFEVLEHMPFEQSCKAVENMAGMAGKYVLISVPDMRYFISGRFTIFGSGPLFLQKLISTRRFRKADKKFGADHHWEIGYEDKESAVRYSASFVRKNLFKGLNVIADYRDISVPWHHYYVIKTGR